MGANQFEVVVAGAGPSGCAAAIALKQAGINVCIADREYDGSHKVGESVPGASVRLLGRLGINGVEELLSEADYKKCRANASAWGSDEWVFQSGIHNPEGGGYHVNRRAFDEALLAKAKSLGIPFYNAMVDSAAKIEYEDASHLFRIGFKDSSSEDIFAEWLIDATGRKTAVGRKFGLHRDKIDDQMAAVNWISVPDTDTDHATRIKSVEDGWWYTSLLPDKSRVIGFQGQPETVATLHKNRELFFERLNSAGILPYKPEPAMIIQQAASEAGVAKPQSVTADGLICVGDAALSFDPLSSQGIFFALYSGIRGAETLIECLASPDNKDKALALYQNTVERIFIENQKSRKYFYMNELRYFNKPYWRSRKFA